MRVLVIGDFHIPTRARALHPLIKDRVERRDYDLILCTGDLVAPTVLEWLRSLTERLHVVRGNMDYLQLPLRDVVLLGDLKIGLTHGSEIRPRGNVRGLTALAKSMHVDILVHGHTHVLSIGRLSPHDPLLLNPGSATGVWSGGGGSLIPSFMILEILQSRALRIFTYELIGGRLKESSKLIKL